MPPKDSSEIEKMTPELDLENPETWPNDVDSLAAIASEDTGKADVFVAESAPKAESTPEGKGEGDKPKDPAPAAAAAEPDKPKEGVATEEDLDKLKPGEAVVKTPDGKHEIPFEVLRGARTRASELEEENRRLQTELTAKQAAEAAAATAAAVVEEPAKKPARVSDVELSNEQKQEVDQVREEYGDQMATMHESQIRTNALLEQQLSESNSIAERLAREDQAVIQDENVQIQNAIDATPQMVAWQTGSDPADGAMYERAVELHHTLVKNDPAYAALGWEERFAALPTKVIAVYGEQGTVVADLKKGAVKDPKPAPGQSEIERKAEEKRLKAEADTYPVTLSDVPSGEIPVADEVTRSLENQSPGQVQEMMNRLASNPDKFNSFLAGLS